MLTFGNRQANRRKHHKSSEGQRRNQTARYKTQLRIEPLEDRRLLSVLGFAVTNLNDGPVAAPGDLPGSLRQAIYDANANPGADTITFDPSLSGSAISLTSGELAITDSVTIQGLGAANLTIDAQGQSRIFNVNDGNNSANINVEIDGLTLTGGNGLAGAGLLSQSNGGGAIYSTENLTVRDLTITGNTTTGAGGGIYSQSPGAAVIENSIISGNTASVTGGGIYLKSTDTTVIKNSTITGNTTGGTGGGVEVLTSFVSTTTTIQGCTISGNTAGDDGGGVHVWSDHAVSTISIQNSDISGNTTSGAAGGIYSGGTGATIIENSTISGNTASRAGGISVETKTATIQNSTISGNTATYAAGGISAWTYGSGGITIQNSTISNNTAGTDAGGIFASCDYADAIRIDSCTISGNVSNGDGGGIWADAAHIGTTTIQNSTILGNTATGNGGGIEANSLWGGAMTLQNCTVTGNVSDSDSNGSGAGGGIFSDAGSVSVQSTIIAGNGDNSQAAPDITGVANITNSLVGDNTGSGLAEVAVGSTDPSGNGNIIGDPNGQGTISAGLAPLADNGGPTQTCALTAGSPAIDMGSNPAGLTTDQRGVGFDRVIGSAPDMGAYEFKPVVSLSLVVDTLSDVNDGDYSPGNLSLREAVALADANPMPDTISFDPSLDGGTIMLTDGELAITDSVVIQGPGAANLTIDAVNHSRIFNVNNGDYNTNIDVAIGGLTLTGGNALGANWWDGSGGAILSFENLTVENCTIQGNAAVDGGGGIAVYTVAGATATIRGSTISGNNADYGGGGIWAQSYGTTEVDGCVISGNATSHDSGGGIYVRANSGGAATVQGSTVSGNTATGPGGGIWVYATDSNTTIEDTTISGNTSADAGGGIWTQSEGASDTTIQGSTVSGNTAAGNGGGIWAFTYGGSTTIQNSTVSGNTAGSHGGGIYSNNYGTATLQNSTVTGNTSNDAGGGVFSHQSSDPTSYYASFPLTVRSTIIAGNTDNSATAPDLSGQLDISFSLVGDNTGSGLTEAPVGAADPSGNIVGDPSGHGVIDPKIGPLANNGGATQTYALLPGSPAIDAGTNPTGLLNDQRGVGFPRELGNQADMGAYETEASPDTTPPVATLNPSSVVVNGSTATFTVTYTDADDNVSRSTIDGNNILVKDPGAITQLASLVSVTPDADGSSLVATYQVNAAGGAWNLLNTGTFTATMQTGQVSDTHDNFAVGGSLGTFIVDAWVPYTPATSIGITTTPQGTTATVSFALADLSTQRVTDWGHVTLQGTTYTVDMAVEQWTGHASGGTVHIMSGPTTSPQFMTIENHTYDLGTVALGSYTFNVTNFGHAAATKTFQVKPPMSIDRVAVAEANRQNGVLESNEPLVITWAVNNADYVLSNRLLVDGNAATAIYGPYGPNADGSFYVAGVFGAVGSGTHQFSIHSANSDIPIIGGAMQSADYSGQFDVVAPKANISHVVVAEASTPKNGILESTDPLVITWAVNGADKAASRSVTIDGKAVSSIYGPYGPQADGSYYFAGTFAPVAAGAHTYVIQSTDKNGVATSANGTFNVQLSGVALSDVVVAEAQTPKSGVIGTAEQIVLTWALTGPTSATTVAANTVLTVDGKVISTKYGPYASANGNSRLWAAVFGPLNAGTHNYVLQSSDGNGHTAKFTGSFKVATAAHLTVDAAQPPQASAAVVTSEQLAPIVSEAERRWAAADGASAAAAMAGVKVQVADLPAGTLGETVGNTILIDRDAAGYGWFVDSTPSDDSEFAATAASHTSTASKGTAADHRVDLLTTVMHELGHVLGLGHVAADDLMNALLPLGSRRIISALDLIGNPSPEHDSVDQLFAAIGN